MALITLPKSFDDIEEPEPLEEDWYPMEICDKIKVDEKKHYMLIPLRIMDSDARYAGRRLNLLLSLPKPEDFEKFTAQGQSYVDFKMQLIRETAEAMGAPMEGNQVEFTEGLAAQFYVRKTVDEETGREQSEIDSFTPARPIG